jgi:hypothetical protein
MATTEQYAIHEREDVAVATARYLENELTLADAALAADMDESRFASVLASLGLGSNAGLPTDDLDSGGDGGETVTRVGGWIRPDAAEGRDDLDRDRRDEHGRVAETYTISRAKWIVVEATTDAMGRLEDSFPVAWTAQYGGRTSVGPTVETAAQRTAIDDPPEIRWLVASHNTVVTRSGDERSPDVSYDDFVVWLPKTVDGVAGRGTDEETTVRTIPVLPQRSRILLE